MATRTHLAPHAAAFFRVDPLALAWMGEFERLLDLELADTSRELLEQGKSTMRRLMHERFQMMNAPRAHYSGLHLEESIHGAPSPRLGGVILEVGAGVVYALQREFGGDIVPRTRPFLVFQTYDGVWHRASSVHQEPTYYFSDTVRHLWAAAPVAYAYATRRALEAALRLATGAPEGVR